MFKNSTFLILILILTSCCNINSTKKKAIKMELPDTSMSHKPDIMYEVKKKAADELMLNKLENGSDSLELRLWARVEVLSGGQVFVIKKISNQWIGLHYFYHIKSGIIPLNYHELTKWATDFTVDTFCVKKIKPVTGWKTFFVAVEKENIYKLPSQSDIKGWKNTVTDGITYSIEYATKDKYKFYSYNCPDVYENEFMECRQMTNILSVFNREFGLNMGIFEEKNIYRCR